MGSQEMDMTERHHHHLHWGFTSHHCTEKYWVSAHSFLFLYLFKLRHWAIKWHTKNCPWSSGHMWRLKHRGRGPLCSLVLGSPSPSTVLWWWSSLWPWPRNWSTCTRLCTILPVLSDLQDNTLSCFGLYFLQRLWRTWWMARWQEHTWWDWRTAARKKCPRTG